MTLSARLPADYQRGLLSAIGPLAKGRLGTWYLSRTQPGIDRTLYRLTRGRATVSGLGGVRMLMLTTIGARTGLERTVPLATVPESGGTFLVLASNFGRASDPAWAFNLRAHPQARISIGGRERPVRSEELDEQARVAAWAGPLAGLTRWRRYDDLENGRVVPIFRLHPVPDRPATRAG